MTSRLLAFAAVAAMLVPASTRAQATVTLPGSEAYGYVPAALVVTAGADVTYLNADPIATPAGAPHDIRSDATRPANDRPWCAGFNVGRCPVLYTPLINALETATVQGIADLEPGVEYGFYCSVHDSMRGTITVIAA